jgi:hypothetical protein
MAVPTAYGPCAGLSQIALMHRGTVAAHFANPSRELLQTPGLRFAPMTTRAKCETLQWLSLCEMAG